MSRLDELIAEYCPNGVEYMPLEKCCRILDNKRKPVTKADRQEGEYPYYGANGIQDYVADYIFDGVYVLVGEDGSVVTPEGKPVVNWATGKIWVNNHAHIIEQCNGVLLRYLYHYLQTVNVAPLIHGNIPKLTGGDFKAISIAVPPIEVQREIVRILDNFTELTAELTVELAAELVARKKQYEYYRDRLLNGDNTEEKVVPRVKLGDIATFTYGFTDTAKTEGDARFIRITDILDNGSLNPTDAKYITLSEESKKYLLKKGDLLMARTGATYGKTLYVPDDSPAVYASFLIKINLDNSKVLNRFYWHFAQSNSYWNQANKLVSTGGQPQFNTGAVSRVMLPVPPIDIQQKIIDVLDHFDSICSDLNIGLPAEIEARKKQYEYYRDLLLSFDSSQIVNVEREREREREPERGVRMR